MEVRLTRGPLSLDAGHSSVRAPGLGGVVLFLGTVRDAEAGRSIEAIEYEAYEPMAERELRKIVGEAEERHGARISVQHRLGVVPSGEPSVVVAAACAHRAEAFAACREVIDRLKERVPIWKTAFKPVGAAA